MAGELLVSVAEVADFLGMIPTDPAREGEKLTEAVEAAHEQVEFKIGPLDTDDIEFVVHQPGPSLVLPLKHLASVVSVVDADDREISASSFTSNLRAGIVTLDSYGRAPWTVTVTAPARSASVRQAIKIVAAHLWETQRGRGSDTKRNQIYTAAADAADGAAPGQGFAFPRRAQQLLAPYMLRGV